MHATEEAAAQVASRSRSLKVFDEPIDFSLNAAVAEPVPLKNKLSRMLDDNADFVLTVKQQQVGQEILDEVGYYSLLEGGDSGQRLETEQEREQEQEQQKEVQQQQDQEIEIEKFVDRDYSRNEETPKPWRFSLLAKRRESFVHPGAVRTLRDGEVEAAEDERRHLEPHQTNDQQSDRAGEEEWHYRLRDFRLKQQASLSFPEYLGISNNFYNRNWRGLRRLKNVVVVLEWAPEASAITPATPPPPVCSADSEPVMKSLRMLVASNDATDNEKVLPTVAAALTLTRDNLAAAIAELTDRPARAGECEELTSRFGTAEGELGYENIHQLVSNGQLHAEEAGRHFVAVSLAEAETIRRILHVRRERPIIDGQDTEIALRYSPLAGGGDASIGSGGVVMDVSVGWKRRTYGTDRPAETGAPAYQLAAAHNCLRFFDSDTHFSEPAVQVLVRALQWSEAAARERFFTTTIGHRRRMECRFEETALVRAVTLEHEWEALKQRAYSAFMRRCLERLDLSLWAAFRAFDQDGDALIAGGELSAAMRWLGVPAPCRSSEDVVDFLDTVDLDRDGYISYKEFMDELVPKRRHRPELLDDAAEEEGTPAVQASADVVPTISTVTPEEAEAVRDVIVRRMRKRQARAREEKLRQGAVTAELEKQSFHDELRRRDLSVTGGANPNIYKSEHAQIEVAEFHFTCGSMPLRGTCGGNCTFKTAWKAVENTSADAAAAEKDTDDEEENPQSGFLPGFSMESLGGMPGFGSSGFGGGGLNAGVAGVAGAAAPAFGFGAAPAFGAPAAFGGGFGAPAFGASPAFGAPAAFGRVFGAPAFGAAVFGGAQTQSGFGASPAMIAVGAGVTHEDEDDDIDIGESAHQGDDSFLDVDSGAQVTLQLPPLLGVAADNSADAGRMEQYSVTVVIRVPTLPPAGRAAALLRFSQPAEVASRYRLCANVFVDSTGCVLTRDMLPDGDEDTNEADSMGGASADFAAGSVSARQNHDMGYVKPGGWHVITVNVDCAAGQATIYVDGALSAGRSESDAGSSKISPELLALGSCITVLGGGKAAEHRGGHVRFISVRRGGLLSDLQIARQTLLKDPSFALPRILCLSELIDDRDDTAEFEKVEDASEQGTPEPEPEPEPEEDQKPIRTQRHSVWLKSVIVASASGRNAAPEEEADNEENDEGEDGIPETIVRLGSIGNGQPGPSACQTARQRLAFYAMSTSKAAHAARHNLISVEQTRVKKAKEEQAIAALEEARAIRAAKAAGTAIKAPSAEAKAELAAQRVVVQTAPIETVPRVARLEDVMDGWPLAHPLCPPAAPTDLGGRGPGESRFVLVSGLPGGATVADVATACAAARGFPTVVSCDRWAADSSSWCVGLWSAAHAKRVLHAAAKGRLELVVNRCPSQDVVPSAVRQGGQPSANQAGPTDDAEIDDDMFCPNCGEEWDPDEGRQCYSCEYNDGGMCMNCGEEAWDANEQMCHECGHEG